MIHYNLTIPIFRHVFIAEQQDDLAEYILFMEIRLFGVTVMVLLRLAFEFATKNRVEH